MKKKTKTPFLVLSPVTVLAQASPVLNNIFNLFHVLSGIQAPVSPVPPHIGDQPFLFPPEKGGLGNIELPADFLGFILFRLF